MKIFHLPDLGEGLAEAEIREWYVNEGDVVTIDQPLVSMETAKAVVDVPSPYAGTIKKLHGKVNAIIQTGAPLISFDTNGEAQEAKGSVVGALEESSKKWDEGEVIVGGANIKSKTVKAMPAARVLAKQMNIDLHTVTPTGPQGLITPDDVKKLLEKSSPAHSTRKNLDQAEPLHGVRRVMAQVMTESHNEVAPATIIEDADVTDLPTDSDLTALVLRAMVIAAKAEPSLNAWFDTKTLERRLFAEVHIGLAVDTTEGLFVPVIKNAENYSIEQFRQQINDFKQAIRNRTISQKEMQGATITLSNFGAITGRYATPIIVPPMVAILGVGRSREMALPRNGQIIIGRLLPLSLTFDHRAVTGGEATRFLGEVIKNLKTSA